MDILKRVEKMISSYEIDGLELFFNVHVNSLKRTTSIYGDVLLRDFDPKEDRPRDWRSHQPAVRVNRTVSS